MQWPRLAIFVVPCMALPYGISPIASSGQQPGETARAAASAEHVVLKGLVVDESKKPVPGVEVNAIVLSHRPKGDALAGSTIASVVGRAKSDERGSFSLRVRRTSTPQDIALTIFAYAKGHGVGGRYLVTGQDGYDVTVGLPKEMTIAAKLLDPSGEPLRAASVALSTVNIDDGKAKSYPFHTPPREISAWPKPYVTRDDGGFLIVGVAANTELELELDDQRAARQRWTVAVGETPESVTLRTEPPRRVVGEVVAGESRLPIAGASVVLTTWETDRFVGHVQTTTNTKGRFDLRPYQGSELAIRVVANGGEYPVLDRRIPWVLGTSLQRMTLPLFSKDYEVLDETTPDGRPASTIDADYPTTEVVHRVPSRPLAGKLTGTLFAGATIRTRDGDSETTMQGIIAIDSEIGRWQMVAKNGGEPRISPDGKQLAFRSVGPDELHIQTLEADSVARRLGDKIAGPASWAPTAGVLVANIHAPARRDYQGQQYWGEECETWRFGTDGHKLRTIPVPFLYSVNDISPDGKWLAMHWDTHAITGSQLFIARFDGSDLKAIARKQHQYYWYPRFSPDGKTVLAKHLHKGKESIRMLALDGAHERSIAFDQGFSPEYACWSPDGAHIAISAYGDSRIKGRISKLFVVDSQGTEIREVILANVSEVSLGALDWTFARIFSR